MDPVSLTASVASIIGVLSIVGKGLEKLYRLRQAPEQVLALLNEISDFRAVLLNLKEIIEGLHLEDGNLQYARRRNDLRISSSQLTMYMETATNQLLELEKLIEYRILVPFGAQGQKPPIMRLRWARAGQEIKEFQRGLNEIKGKIHMTLSTLTTSQVSQVRLGLYSVEAMVSQVRDQQRELSAVNMNILRDVQQAVAQREVKSGDGEQALLQSSTRTQESTLQETTARDTPKTPQSNMPRQKQNNNTIRSSSTKLDVLQINTTYACRLTCDARCSCVCHRRRGVQTPSFLQKSIGSLFVGYGGGLVQTPKCDEPRCSRPSQRSTQITYYFLMWCISYAIAATIRGPQVSLTALRVRHSEELAFLYAQEDDWDRLSKLFDEGLASSFDVDQDGQSILHVS